MAGAVRQTRLRFFDPSVVSDFPFRFSRFHALFPSLRKRRPVGRASCEDSREGAVGKAQVIHHHRATPMCNAWPAAPARPPTLRRQQAGTMAQASAHRGGRRNPKTIAICLDRRMVKSSMATPSLQPSGATGCYRDGRITPGEGALHRGFGFRRGLCMLFYFRSFSIRHALPAPTATVSTAAKPLSLPVDDPGRLSLEIKENSLGATRHTMYRRTLSRPVGNPCKCRHGE